MQQKSKVIERCRLSETEWERNLSDRIVEMNTRHIENYDQHNHAGREAEAKRLREIIENCETEEEMIRRIGELD